MPHPAPVFRGLPPPAGSHRSRRGFALLITITLVAFLVLVLVGLATLTRVETQVASNGQQQEAARQHALLALNIAIGQLQRFAGPDQRVTTTADFGNGTDNARPVPVAGTKSWTGVWGNAKAPTDDRGSPVFLNWLVSGNDAVSVQANADGSIGSPAGTPVNTPDDSVSSLSSATALSSDITVGSTAARLLVGPGTVGTTASGGLGEDGYVVAPLESVTVPATTVPGLGSSGNATIGRYAWWVGDEGIKARVNLVESETRVASIDDDEKRLRYAVAPRGGVELMDNASLTLTSSNLADSSGADLRGDLRKVVEARQLQMASSETAFAAAFIQSHYHDLSSVSRGVISDTLSGGLRTDLSAAFAEGTGKNDSPTGPIWKLGSNDDDKGPDWQLLRSYYQLPLSTGASGSGASLALSPRPQIDGTTDTTKTAQQGIYPVVAFWQWYVETRLNGSGGTYALELRYYPAIVLWNPYDVTLSDHTYHVGYQIAGRNITFARVSARTYTSDGSETAYTRVPPAISAEAQVATPWVDSMNIAVQSGDMKPGCAYVYTLAANTTYTTDTAGAYTLQRGWNGAGQYAVVVTGDTFTLPGAAEQYMVSLWCGTNNSGTGNTIPDWNASSLTVTNPATSSTEPTIRDDTLTLADASGNTLQIVSRNNNYENAFKMRHALKNGQLLYQDIADNLVVGYLGHRWALKTTALGTLSDSSYRKNNPVRWLADYNPRAANSSRSPFELQSSDGYSYFDTNPSYNFASAGIRYGSGPFNPINAQATIACDPDTGRAFVAMSQDNWDGPDESTAVLFDIPRKEQPVLSIGRLQHAQLYRFEDTPPFASNYYPAYAVGNSLANPRVGLDATSRLWTGIISGTGYATARVIDQSYLLNRALWDGYFFSGVPRGSTVSFPLPNPRMTLRDRGADDVDTELLDHQKSAADLLVSGAFNINSASEQAWRALLGGLNNVPVGATSRAKSSPYPRTTYPGSDASPLDATASGDAGMSAEAYEGYRFLGEDEIKTLATEIVRQVRRRGPFVSLADFVNRALDAGSVSTQDNRRMGALAQALADAGVNAAFTSGQQARLPQNKYTAMEETAATGLTATNVPGWVSQADLLQALGPVISARSDTFTIRAYGEVVDPLLNNGDARYVKSRAWCEAVVQRLPDYVNANDDPWVAPADLTIDDNRTFGRRFEIVSLRWLSPDDI